MESKSKTLASGHSWEKISGDEYERQSRDFIGYKMGMVRLSPGGWYLPIAFPKYADRLYNFQFKSSDVLVMTYPKMGTTWTQELVWTMRNNPNLDNPQSSLILMARSPFMEMDSLYDNDALPPMDKDHPYYRNFQAICPGRDPKNGIMLQTAEMTPDPRTLKTHLPLSLFKEDLLDKLKIVYVARNPKDGVISYLHHCRLIKAHGYVGTTDQFVEYFLDDEMMFSPYWEHIREAWMKRDNPNMHFMFFEDLKQDTEAEVKKLAKFINVELTDQQLKNVIQHSSFDSMKNSPSAHFTTDKRFVKNMGNIYNKEVMEKDGGFFRKGRVGSWKEALSPENERKIDEWTETNTTGLDFSFKYV